jgi:putative acetyltransferase
MTGLDCRLATAADVPALAEIYAGAARALGPSVYGPEQVAAWAQFGRDTPAFRDYVLKARTWVVEDGNGAMALGFCGIGEEEGRHGEVHSLYVRPGHTRRGLGAQLLAHALADARGRGLQHFSAWVTPLSRPLFLRSGFELIETVVAPYQGVLFERHRVATRTS